MDILKQTVRKEGFFALYKGPYSRYDIFKNLNDYDRHGKSTGWNRGRKFASFRVIWHFKTHNIPLSPAVSPGDIPGGYGIMFTNPTYTFIMTLACQAQWRVAQTPF
jgi:hypothetical protein